MSGTEDTVKGQTLYATRVAGRSNGVVHLDRQCQYIKSIDDADIIKGETYAFYPDQKLCSNCTDGGKVRDLHTGSYRDGEGQR